MGWGRRVAALTTVLAMFALTGCGVLEEARTGGGEPVETVNTTVDAEVLVEQMWGTLTDEGRVDLCDLYDQAGDDAGVVFIAGLESNPVADQLTDADQEEIKRAGLGLLRQQC